MTEQARPTWTQLLARERPLLLPIAHDALSARLIERAGFSAYSIGGFPLVGARHALPDIGLVGLGEMSAGMRDIMAAWRPSLFAGPPCLCYRTDVIMRCIKIINN